MDASHVYVGAWALGCFHSHISTQTFRRALTASADSCAEMKNAPSVWVTSSGRVRRKAPDSDTRSVGEVHTERGARGGGWGGGGVVVVGRVKRVLKKKKKKQKERKRKKEKRKEKKNKKKNKTNKLTERERILCLMSSDVMRHIRDKLYVTLNTNCYEKQQLVGCKTIYFGLDHLCRGESTN